MNIRTYLKENKKTTTEFASEIGLKTHSAVVKWCNRKSIPRQDIMERIVVATGGQVTPNDFYESQNEAG